MAVVAGTEQSVAVLGGTPRDETLCGPSGVGASQFPQAPCQDLSFEVIKLDTNQEELFILEPVVDQYGTLRFQSAPDLIGFARYTVLVSLSVLLMSLRVHACSPMR
eukprot:1755509-Rhodomonas_salina.2